MSSIQVDIQINRFDRVSSAVKEMGWSRETCRLLAIEFNCSMRAVDRYWHRLRRNNQRSMRVGDRDMWAAQDVADLSDIAREAKSGKDYKAAVKAIHTRALITGTIAPVKVDARLQVTAAYVPIYVDKATGESRRMTRAEIESELATRAPVGALPNVIEAASTVVSPGASGVAVPTVNGDSLTNDDDTP